MRYPNAAKGIKKIWIAEILSIVAAVLTIVMVVAIPGSPTGWRSPLHCFYLS